MSKKYIGMKTSGAYGLMSYHKKSLTCATDTKSILFWLRLAAYLNVSLNHRVIEHFV